MRGKNIPTGPMPEGGTHSSFNNYIIPGTVSIQSNLYLEVTFEKKKKWPYKTGDLLKGDQFI
jgi:hypothetical protein